MSSLRRHEGYLLVDNRESPGVTREMVKAPSDTTFIGQGLYESATFTCSHCQRVVILNPQRTRERGYCRKCDHYICDACTTVMAQTRECRPMQKILDELQEQALRAQEQDAPTIIVP